MEWTASFLRFCACNKSRNISQLARKAFHFYFTDVAKHKYSYKKKNRLRGSVMGKMKIFQSPLAPLCVLAKEICACSNTVPSGVHHDQNFGRFSWCVYMLGPCSVFVCLCQHCLVFEIKHTLMLKATTMCAAKKGPMPSMALVQDRARLLVLVLCSQVGVIYCSSGHLYCTNEHRVH